MERQTIVYSHRLRTRNRLLTGGLCGFHRLHAHLRGVHLHSFLPHLRCNAPSGSTPIDLTVLPVLHSWVASERGKHCFLS